jgi:hypothetical protein
VDYATCAETTNFLSLDFTACYTRLRWHGGLPGGRFARGLASRNYTYDNQRTESHINRLKLTRIQALTRSGLYQAFFIKASPGPAPSLQTMAVKARLGVKSRFLEFKVAFRCIEYVGIDDVPLLLANERMHGQNQNDS